MKASATDRQQPTLRQAIEQTARQLDAAGVAYGHGTCNAFDEAAWLVLWQLGLPLDTPLEGDAADSRLACNQRLNPAQQEQLAALLAARIQTRQPAAYLTHEAWLMGVPFYVDERSIVPRSLIAELLINDALDPWLGEHTHRVLDLCTGNGSLAVLAAMAYPQVTVDASDISAAALEVARVNVGRHQLGERIHLLASDAFKQINGRYDLILCNPPYINAQSMAALPAEFKAEPALALDGNRQGGTDGMDFIRHLLQQAAQHMSEQAVLVLEIGNERSNFEAAFPALEAIWLPTSAGDEQVLLLTPEALTP